MNTPNSSTNPPSPGYPPGYTYPNAHYLQEEKPVNWRKYLFIFFSNWYWFLITLGIAIGIAYFKSRYTIPKYQATATLIIQDELNSNDVFGEMRAARFYRRQADMANEKENLLHLPQ